MIPSLKSLGLTLVAVFAMGAVVASTASAQFHSEKDETTLTVSSNKPQFFEYGLGIEPGECKKIVFDATLPVGTTTTTSITLHPEYGECTGPLGLKADVVTTGCNYILTLAQAETKGTLDIECDANKSITITVTTGTGGTFCTYHIGAQGPLGSIEYENIGMGAAREVVMKPFVIEIAATRTGSAFCGPAATANAILSGNLTVKAESPGTNVQFGFWVS